MRSVLYFFKFKLSFATIFASLFFLCAGKMSAQYYSIGTDPTCVRWKIMESTNYKVIYPEETDSIARRYLFMFENTRKMVNEGIRIQSDKISLILHPYTSISNASVVWAPKRVEIITTPPAYRSYADNWEHQLAVHEGRHIGQMTHYTRGIFKVLYYLMGEQSVGIGAGLYPSRWFLEGDATLTETDFSNSGRGRDADFLMYFRAAFLEGDLRKYNNWRYGSYKHFTPDNYAFGHFTESAVRYFSGNFHFSGDIIGEFVDRWYNPGVWNIAFKKYTGTTGIKHFRKATQLMTDIWTKDYLARGKFTPVENLVPLTEKSYTSYFSPMPMAGNRIIAAKNGFTYAKHLVSIDSSGKEKILRPFSISTSTPIKKNDSTIVWTEIVPDIRWALRDFSIVRSYNVVTGKIKNITHCTRYHNPSFSCGKDTIAVAEYPVRGSSFLTLINAENGKIISRTEAPFSGQIKNSTWIGKKIYAGVITDRGWGVYKIDSDNLEKGWDCEIEDQSRTIYNLTTSGDNLIFQSDLDGITNIYMYSPESKYLQKMTNVRFGAFDPTFDEKTNFLYFTDFDKRGYHPVKAHADSLLWSPADFKKPYKSPVAEVLVQQAKLNTTNPSPEQERALKDSISEIIPKNYSKITSFMRIHSWAPFYANIERIKKLSFDHYYQLVSLGATALSQNSLGTATTIVGYSYHNGFHSAHLNFNYQGLLPVFELSVDFNDRKRTKTQITGNEAEATKMSSNKNNFIYEIDTLSSPSLDASLKIYVPFNFSRSGWQSGLIPEFVSNYTNDQYSLFGKSYQYKRNFSYSLLYYRMLPRTKTNVFPRLGFGIQASGAFAHGPENHNGNIAYFYAYGYLPGFTKKQGWRFTASYQKQYSNGFSGFLPNLASMPRGYSKIILKDYMKFSADYAIPIYLGDFERKGLFYLMRLKTIPFVDIAINNLHKSDHIMYYSLGADLLVDGHFLRIGQELSVGVRYVCTWNEMDSKINHHIKALFSTNL